MKLADLIAKKYADGGMKTETVHVVDGKVPFAAKVGMAAAAVSAGLVMSAMMSTPNAIDDKKAQDIIANNTVTVLSQGVHMARSFSFEAVESAFGGDNDSSIAKTKFDCQVKLDKQASMDVKVGGTKIPSGLSSDTVFAFTYLHEQAHCLDSPNIMDSYSGYLETTRAKMTGSDVTLSQESFADAYAYITMAVKDPAQADQLLDALKVYRSHAEPDHRTLQAVEIAGQVWKERGDQIKHLYGINKEEAESLISGLANMIAAKVTSEIVQDKDTVLDMSMPAIIKNLDNAYEAGVFFNDRQMLGVENREEAVKQADQEFEYDIKKRTFETRFFVNPDAIEKLKVNKDMKLHMSKVMRPT